MIDADSANKAVKNGLVAMCAWCERLWESYDKTGSLSCREDCGGPASSRGFPRYKGPWRQGRARFCFRCGGEATAMVEFRERDGERHMIGICEEHMDELKRIVGSQKGVIVKEKRISIMDLFDSEAT